MFILANDSIYLIKYFMCSVPNSFPHDRSLLYFISNFLCEMLINLTIIVGFDGVFKDLKT